MSYALAEYKVPVKIPLGNMSLTERATKDVVLTLRSFLNEGQAELVNVSQHLGELDNLVYDCDSEIKQVGTFFVVSILLDHHEREDWRTFDALIKDKVIKELDSDDLYISVYSENESESFIAFVKDYD